MRLLRHCKWLLVVLGLAILPEIFWAGNGAGPPFDFADAFYLQNGIDPSLILDRVGSSTSVSSFVVDNSNTDPDRRNIRVTETTGGFDHAGNPLYGNIFGFVTPNTFTNDVAGQRAMNIANFYRAFVFAKASGDPFGFALSNRRQDNLFDTANGYFNADPLGLEIMVFVSYTPAAFNTAAGQKALAALAAKNGTDLDGTPILEKVTEVVDLTKQGFVFQQTRALDGSQGFPWIIGPQLEHPTEGSIAPDAFLDFVKRPDGTPVDPNLVTQFNCLQQTGNFCK